MTFNPVTVFPDAAVKQAFGNFPEAKRKRLLQLRGLIFDVAAGTADIGKLEETLKWGEPAYIADKGTTLRLGWLCQLSVEYCRNIPRTLRRSGGTRWQSCTVV